MADPSDAMPGREDQMPQEPGRPETSERVEWLELFFDLVVVAALAIFAEALREDLSWSGLGLFAVTYGAVWFAWISVVMYADVAGELTRVRTVVVSMLLLAVMAAASPGHAGHRANAFAAAFVLVRVFAARGSLSTGRLMSSWPLLQSQAFLLPWVVSFWVPVPAKYWLWAGAVAFELGLVLVRGDQLAQQTVGQYRQRADKLRESPSRREAGSNRVHAARPEGQSGHQRGRRREVPELREVEVDRAHLDERLGLFMIIVLGESVAALVLIAARSEWTTQFVVTALAAFVMLILLWLLTFSYGYAAAPSVSLGDLAPRVGLPIHLVSTTGILLIGVGLGEAAATSEHLPDPVVWLTCAGLTLHASASGLAGLLGGTGRFWLLSCALPTVVFPLVLAAVTTSLDHGLSDAVLIWLLALPVGWQFLYAQRTSALLSLGKLQPSKS
jgi:low temperature requirement protein LtrA